MLAEGRIKLKSFGKLLEKKWAAYTMATCSAVCLYLLLNNLPVFFGWLSALWKFLSPVVIGVVVAYLLNPISDFFEFKVFHKMKKPGAAHGWSVVMTVLCFVLFLTVILIAFIPSLIKSVSKLISNWDEYYTKLAALLDRVLLFAQEKNIKIDTETISQWVDNSMNSVVELLKNNVKNILTALGNIGTSVSNFAIGILFGICFLVSEKSLVQVIAKIRALLFKKETLERNNDLWRRCHKVFIRYVGCTLLDAVIIGVGTFIFCLIMRFPYAGLIAVVVGLTNIIPTFGPMIGNVIGCFFLILDKPLNALIFFIFMCVWQSIDGMIIKPRLFKGSLGIPAVWTLVLIILGGKIGGMLGIILAIPLAAILVILYQETVEPRVEKRIRKINSGNRFGRFRNSQTEAAQSSDLTEAEAPTETEEPATPSE